MSIRRRSWLLALLLLLIPLTAGATEVITPAQYQDHLRQVVASLEAGDKQKARELTGMPLLVTTPNGIVDVDLRSLHRSIDEAGALPVAKAYLRAAEGAPGGGADDASRAELAGLLAEYRGEKAFWQRIQDWWQSLFDRKVPAPSINLAGPERMIDSPAFRWITGGIALLVLLFFGRSLYRTLAGIDRKTQTLTHLARRRHLTPAERLAEARALATSGDYQEALRYSFLALLQELDRLGLIRYLPAGTIREHGRQFARQVPSLSAPFQDLAGLVESRLFSGRTASAADWAAGEALIDTLWREGDALSRSVGATTGS